MKICFYGATANNLYNCAKAFYKIGYDISFIRDWDYPFAFSQPIWEDVQIMLAYDILKQTSTWSPDKWYELENEYNWKNEQWFVDPIDCLEDHKISAGNLFERLVLKSMTLKRRYLNTVINLMRKSDVIFVCGEHAAFYAMLSGKPYVIIPHGSDVRRAYGMDRPKWYKMIDYFHYSIWHKISKKTFSNAVCVATDDPNDARRSNVKSYKHEGFKNKKLTLPVEMKQRLPKNDRTKLLHELALKLGVTLPSARYVGFVPSRVDYSWKGTDRLLKAFEKVNKEGNVHLIIAGWGADYEKSRISFGRDKITYLPCVISKPLLYEFYSACDFVVDQFVIGAYGTAALEAMGYGAPVIMWLDRDKFDERGWHCPPVINARTEKDIEQALSDIIRGTIDLDAEGQKSNEWIGKVLNSSIPNFMRELKSDLL